jgi:hypothetical protein
MPGHNLNMAVLGCFILAFGWFGFNPGSTLGAMGNGNLRIGVIAVVTMLAGASASVTAMFYAKATLGKWDRLHAERAACRPGRDHGAIRLGEPDQRCLIGRHRRRARLPVDGVLRARGQDR